MRKRKERQKSPKINFPILTPVNGKDERQEEGESFFNHTEFRFGHGSFLSLILRFLEKSLAGKISYLKIKALGN